MIPVSAEVIDLFRKHYRARVEIDVAGVPGLTQLHDGDLVEDGLALDRYCFPSDAFEIGTATEGELEIELNNADGRFNDYLFDGAFLTARLYIKKWDARNWENAQLHTLPLGKFCVDDVTKNKASITLCALDNMAQFDRYVDDYDLDYPATLGEILSHACTRCAVALATPTFPNSDFLVQSCPDTTDLTYHQIVAWVAQLAGCNAFCDHNGDLCLAWFTDTGVTLSPSDRTDSELSEDTATVTGVCLVSTSDVEYLAGTTDTCISIEGNKLAQGDLSSVAANIYKQVGGFSYLAYSAEIFPCPFLMPMDMITYRDTAGGEHKTIVSNVTYRLFGKTLIDGKGMGVTQSSRAMHGEMTAYERFVIEQSKKQLENKLAEEHAGTLLLNQIVSGAVGLYRSEVVDESGSTVWYYHDKSTLAESAIIYTFNENGFAFTKSWNGGNPVWQYGITREGSAILNALYAHKVTADMIDADAVTAEKIAAKAVTAEKIQVDDLSALGATIGGWNIGKDRLYSDQVGLYMGTEYTNRAIKNYWSQTAGTLSPIKFYAGDTDYTYSAEIPLKFYYHNNVNMIVDIPQSGGTITDIHLDSMIWKDQDVTDETLNCVISAYSDHQIHLFITFDTGAVGSGIPAEGDVVANLTYQYDYGVAGSPVQILNDGSMYASAICVSETPLEGIDSNYNVLIRNGKIRVKAFGLNHSDVGYSIPLIYFKPYNDDRLFALSVAVIYGEDDAGNPVNYVHDTVNISEVTGLTDIL